MSEIIRTMFELHNSHIETKKIKFMQRYKAGKLLALLKLIKKDFLISQKDAYEDFEAFKFAIDNLYCGKPFHEKNGVNFEECYGNIKDFIDCNKKLSALELCNEYEKALKNKFTDNHFAFFVPTDKINKIRIPCSRCYLPYFSGITVEKNNGDFVVVKSENKQIKTGDIIEDNGCMFLTFPVDGAERYLVGCRSWDKTDSMNIICNGVTVSVPLHLCRTGEKENKEIIFSLSNIKGYNVIRSNTFSPSTDKTTSLHIKKIGSKLKDSDAIVMDLRHNNGGNSIYSSYFINELNGYCVNPYTVCKLMTCYHDKKLKNKMEWIITEAEKVNLSEAKYEGNLIVLTDYHCASSAEETVNFTKSIKNTVRVGTNTLGCNCFTNLYVAFLPKTHMAMYLPNTAILDMFEEGKGFEPDYWIDSDNPVNEITEWLTEK